MITEYWITYTEALTTGSAYSLFVDIPVIHYETILPPHRYCKHALRLCWFARVHRFIAKMSNHTVLLLIHFQSTSSKPRKSERNLP